MIPVPDDERGGSPYWSRCAECAAPLAHDQRYCVICGARRGGLPQAIAERIEAMLARGDVEALAPGPAVPAAAAAPAAAAPESSMPASGSSPSWRSMPSPRAAAASIMAMLAFGVVIGSITSTNAESLNSAPVVFAVRPPAPAAAPAVTAPATPTPAPTSAGSGSASSTAASSSSGSGGSSSSSSGGSGGSGGGGSSSTPSTLPPVKHVFVIVLADQRYDQSFGTPTSDPYLAKTLRKQGELLPNYYAVAQGDLANEIALTSGQGPSPQTAMNCPIFANLAPGVAGTEGQVLGSGCVYPSSTLSLADQLTTAGKTWRAYVEGMSNGPRGQAKTCRHPALGGADPGQAANLQDPYVTWSNPFAYYASIGKAACAKYDVSLSRLETDLKSVSTTPSLSYIAPSPCDDGNPQPCVPGAQSGLAAADRFLRGVLPEILASPAYKADGMIAITFDQAPQTGPYADASSCCSNPAPYPNLPATTTTTTPTTTTTTPTTTTPTTNTPTTTATTPTTTTPTTTTTTPTTTTPTTPTTTTPTTTTPTTTTPTTTTPTTPASELTGQTTPTGGGGEVGLLLISKYVKPNSVDTLSYFNHYSLLSSLEQLFGLKRLGYAKDIALPSFGKTEYNHYTP